MNPLAPTGWLRHPCRRGQPFALCRPSSPALCQRHGSMSRSTVRILTGSRDAVRRGGACQEAHPLMSCVSSRAPFPGEIRKISASPSFAHLAVDKADLVHVWQSQLMPHVWDGLRPGSQSARRQRPFSTSSRQLRGWESSWRAGTLLGWVQGENLGQSCPRGNGVSKTCRMVQMQLFTWSRSYDSSLVALHGAPGRSCSSWPTKTNRESLGRYIVVVPDVFRTSQLHQPNRA